MLQGTQKVYVKYNGDSSNTRHTFEIPITPSEQRRELRNKICVRASTVTVGTMVALVGVNTVSRKSLATLGAMASMVPRQTK
jgi:hypothetical protein